MVAGFLAGWLQTGRLPAMHLTWESPAGSASAFSENLATGKEVEAVYRQVPTKTGGGKHMRITDLLDRRSVLLSAAPKSKSEALDMAVDLMVKSEKISDREAYRKQVYAREAGKYEQESEKELPFHMVNVTQYRSLVLLQW